MSLHKCRKSILRQWLSQTHDRRRCAGGSGALVPCSHFSLSLTRILFLGRTHLILVWIGAQWSADCIAPGNLLFCHGENSNIGSARNEKRNLGANKKSCHWLVRAACDAKSDDFIPVKCSDGSTHVILKKNRIQGPWPLRALSTKSPKCNELTEVTLSHIQITQDIIYGATTCEQLPALQQWNLEALYVCWRRRKNFQQQRHAGACE